jgi:choline dehydrogenase-like flavoprotein
VARTLTESGRFTVLLLEAGEDHDWDEEIVFSFEAPGVGDDTSNGYLWETAQLLNPVGPFCGCPHPTV